MKVKSAILIILIFMGIGCSIYPDRTFTNRTIETGNINVYSPKGKYCNPGKTNENSNIHNLMATADKLIQTPQQPCRIKYHELYNLHRNIVIEGNLGSSADKHPVVLDTGASQPVVLNAALVRKNNLPIYNLENINTDFNGQQLGICQLSKLDIGQVALEKWPCIYLESNKGLNIFGIPIASSTYGKDNIILGLPLLREFKYIIFDNINKEAVLSYHEPFEPQNPGGWEKYPISIEEDFHGNAFLFVKLSVAGYETELQLDTGSGRGIAIGETLWEKINNNLKEVKLKKGKDYYPYIGNLSCKKGKISKLEFGNRTIDQAEISVFDDDCPLLDGCEGLIGMQYFSNTEIVLDFDNNLMWLREQNHIK